LLSEKNGFLCYYCIWREKPVTGALKSGHRALNSGQQQHAGQKEIKQPSQ